MKKINLIGIVLFLLIIIAVGAVIFIYKDTGTIANNESAIKTQTSTQPDLGFSPASLSWSEATASAPWETRDSHGVVIFKNKIWVMGGVDANKRIISPGNIDYGNSPHLSDVWSSDDGVNWKLVLSKAPWGPRRSIQVVDFKGKMWLMGGYSPEIGYKSDVWSSEDGLNWKLETDSAAWPAREGHQLLVSQNKMWLIGGVRYTSGRQLFTDVWSSDDGTNWIEATKNAGWSPRWDFASEVFNDKIWTMGGMDFDGKLFNDVWSSSDGITWSLVNKNPPFATRQGGGLINYQNKLWVVSRLNVPIYGGGANDVWYSDDGISWKKTDQDPAWTGREDVGVVVFKDRIWVMGGMDENWKWTNDVWYSTSNIDTK